MFDSGIMKDFQLTFNSIGYFIQEVTKLLRDNQTKKFRVNIVAWREKRSLSQNSLYWKWLGEISKQQNITNDPEIWHEIFKKYYCPEKSIEIPIAGVEPVMIKSTKKLDVGEMTYYLNRIENFCIDRSIKITIPEDSEYYELMEYQSS